MKSITSVLLWMVLCLILASCRHGPVPKPVLQNSPEAEKTSTTDKPSKAAKEPEAEEPLRLPDTLLMVSTSDGPMADNSRCFVCHMNYMEEKLATTHAQAEVGCEKCHGVSDAHCADENNITPPDIIFAKEDVVSACMTCHEPARTEFKKHFVEGKCKKSDCMECHGEHRLSERTRHWDPKTRKLLPNA